MQDLEKKFGKPHPELVQHRPISSQLVWLQSAFLRLHRRRKSTDMGGLQPLGFEEISVFAKDVIQIPYYLVPFFSWVMEETDDAVLFEIHRKREAESKTKDSPKSKR